MISDILLAETTEYLHREIPLTRAMGVSVASYDDGQLVVSAPLKENHNHLGTAFGGSLSTLATLAGYVLVWLELRDRTAHVVVRRSKIEFRRPVREELRAICQRPNETALTEFRTEFQRAGKASLALRVTISDAGRPAVDFQGTFIAVTSGRLATVAAKPA